jgi:thioredoxin-related protein
LPDELGRTAVTLNVVLFSRTDCGFCNEVREHYLRPLMQQKPTRVAIAEIEIGSARRLHDWHGRRVSHAEFARGYAVQFAPTVLFLDWQGEKVEEPIVGLSRDFFGAYLDTRMVAGLKVLSLRSS